MIVNKSGSPKLLNKADDAPELNEEWFGEADLMRGRKLLRPGRPKGSGKKELVSLRLDKEVLSAFRGTGPGWQARINDTLTRSARRRAKV